MNAWGVVPVALIIWLLVDAVLALILTYAFIARITQGMQEHGREHERMKEEFKRDWSQWGHAGRRTGADD